MQNRDFFLILPQRDFRFSYLYLELTRGKCNPNPTVCKESRQEFFASEA